MIVLTAVKMDMTVHGLVGKGVLGSHEGVPHPCLGCPNRPLVSDPARPWMSIFKIRIWGVVLYHVSHVTALSMLLFLCLLSTMLLAMSCCTRCSDLVGNRNVCSVFVNM